MMNGVGTRNDGVGLEWNCHVLLLHESTKALKQRADYLSTAPSLTTRNYPFGYLSQVESFDYAFTSLRNYKNL